MRFSLIPRSYRFHDLFEQDARNLVLASEALTDLLEHFQNVELKTGRIRELEHQGDEITHELYTQIHQTFVTPLDREDIAALAERMDDMMDYMEEASTSVRIYDIEQPTQVAKSLADLVRLQCIQIERAVAHLRRRADMRKIHEHLVEVNRLENEADRLFRNASAELFRNGTGPTDIIKWRDIYGHLENASDSAEQVAQVLEGIVLKHA